MFKLSRKYVIGAFTVLVFALFSTSSIALVITYEGGIWPASWPKELEPYRKQAKTFEIGTGIQENVYEIRFKNREEFEKLWPIILKLKDKGAPIRLRSIEKPFKKGSLFNNEKPVVRIYSHVWPAHGASRSGGKKLIPAPPWPDSIKSPTGELPEYLTISEDGMTWVPVYGQWPEHVTVTVSKDWKTLNPVEIKKPRGFLYRARTEIALVVDGTIIDLNRICFPADTPIIDKHKVQNQRPAIQFNFINYEWGKELDGLMIGISQVRQSDKTNDSDKLQFRVALQNIGEKDLVLNLGIMLANGKEQYSTAVKLIFTDPNGKSYEFHNNIGRHPGIAGRLDPFVVPLAVGCSYVLSVNFDNHWFVPIGTSLPSGRYKVVAVFDGKDLNLKDSGVYTRDLYWTGTIKSKATQFEPFVKPATQLP